MAVVYLELRALRGQAFAVAFSVSLAFCPAVAHGAFFPATTKVFVEFDPSLWSPTLCQSDMMLMFRFRENDEEVSRLSSLVTPIPCSGPLPRGNHGLSFEFIPAADVPFPRGTDSEDDLWIHAMAFTRETWEAAGSPQGDELLALPPPDDSLSPAGELDFELLQELRPVGSATALFPVGPVGGIEILPLPQEDGDAFASNSAYGAFTDCRPNDAAVSPFERERLDDLPTARDNDCDGIVGAAYQRLLLSTAGQIDLPAAIPPHATNNLAHRFRARPEDVVVLLRGNNGIARLSHIDLNLSRLSENLRSENVDAVIAIDRDLEFPPFTGKQRLRAGDLALSFATRVPRAHFGEAGASLPATVGAQDLVLYRRQEHRFELLFDGVAAGLNQDVAEDVDAAELVLAPIGVGGTPLAAGDLLLSTRGALAAPAQTSGTLHAHDEDLVVFRPTALGPATAGRFLRAPLVDGQRAWKRNLDALALVELVDDLPGTGGAPGDLLVSTASAYTIEGQRVEKQDLAVFRPDGGGGAMLVAPLRGATAGLEQDGEDVDAVDFDRFAAVYGRACFDPAIGDGILDCSIPLRGFQHLVTPAGLESEPWLQDLPVVRSGNWGWDRLRPGSYSVVLQPDTFSVFWGCVEAPAGTKLPLRYFDSGVGISLIGYTATVNDRRVLPISLGTTPRVIGRVYRDLDSDGVFDSGEPPLALSVRLWRDDGNGLLGKGDLLVASTKSDPTTGQYTLYVPPGLPCRARYLLQYLYKSPLRPLQAAPLLLEIAGQDLIRDLRFAP